MIKTQNFLYDVPASCSDSEFFQPLSDDTIVYRAVAYSDHVEADDFIPAAMKPENRGKIINSRGAALCRYWGVSLFSDINELRAKQKVSTYKQMPRFIARARIERHHGLQHASQHTSHMDWYPYADVEPEKLFTNVA